MRLNNPKSNLMGKVAIAVMLWKFKLRWNFLFLVTPVYRICVSWHSNIRHAVAIPVVVKWIQKWRTGPCYKTRRCFNKISHSPRTAICSKTQHHAELLPSFVPRRADKLQSAGSRYGCGWAPRGYFGSGSTALQFCLLCLTHDLFLFPPFTRMSP